MGPPLESPITAVKKKGCNIRNVIVYKTLCPFVIPCVQNPGPLPAIVTQNITNKSCYLLRVKIYKASFAHFPSFRKASNQTNKRSI